MKDSWKDCFCSFTNCWKFFAGLNDWIYGYRYRVCYFWVWNFFNLIWEIDFIILNGCMTIDWLESLVKKTERKLLKSIQLIFWEGTLSFAINCLEIVEKGCRLIFIEKISFNRLGRQNSWNWFPFGCQVAIFQWDYLFSDDFCQLNWMNPSISYPISKNQWILIKSRI